MARLTARHAEAEAERLSKQAAELHGVGAGGSHFDALRRDIPHAVPPGPIAERIKQDAVSEAVRKHVLAAHEFHAAHLARVQEATPALHGRFMSARDAHMAAESRARTARKGIKEARANLEKATAELDSARAAIMAHGDVVRAARDAQAAHVHAILRADRPTPISFEHGPVTTTSGQHLDPLNADTRAMAAKGAAFVSSVTQAGGGANPVNIRIGQAKPGEDDRAHHGETYIKVKDGEFPSVVAHELGHHLEYAVGRGAGGPTLGDHALAFLNHRVGDERAVPMQQVVPNGKFTPDEMGRKDRFEETFGTASAHYVGKDYGGHATEIMSMAMNQLHDSPAHLAKSDPELFKFAMGSLHGQLR
jgi:hypothetical protein